MQETDFFTRERKYINPRCWQLIREASTSRYLQKELPEFVNGFHLSTPVVNVSFSLSGIQVISKHYPGEMQMIGLYHPEKVEKAILMGASALQGLLSISISTHPFGLWNNLYQPVRTFKALSLAARGKIFPQTSFLKRFISIVRRPANPRRLKYLVHGNLHGGNILLDYEHNDLALVDLEMVHIDSPAVDFGMLWVTHYMASPELAGLFTKLMLNSMPILSQPDIMLEIQREITIEASLMLEKARNNRNNKLLAGSQMLMNEIVECSSPAELLKY